MERRTADDTLIDLASRVIMSAIDAHEERAEPSGPGDLVSAPSQRQVEQELLASELQYRRLFEAGQGCLLLLDAATDRITDVNPYLLDLLHHGEISAHSSLERAAPFVVTLPVVPSAQEAGSA